ncbi:calcipressin-2 [Exaiptasia diaphana]|uniref:Calcipressin n=1 Tax=Exaiptasia diaphana TaxID=2652724 RepID=A0A913XZF4_EXADI|nr:calcipressin-2 [Exaiptasia diaphana]KXJ23724.1 Calcipressin-2 [Exaiptasia diaphana]
MRLDDEMTDADDKMEVNGSEDTEMVDDEPSTENASCCLSVTNVPDAVFDDENIKQELAQLFTAFDEEAKVSYLKSFRRVRVAFRDADHASDAKIVLNGCTYRGCELGVYFVKTQPCTSSGESSQLRPPPLTKQFLISPPSSPPVGWEQTHESHPVINYDLLQAMASLDKSEPYELHPPDINAPSIVVHLCDKDEGIDEQEGEVFHPLKSLPREVVQTRRPNAE